MTKSTPDNSGVDFASKVPTDLDSSVKSSNRTNKKSKNDNDEQNENDEIPPSSPLQSSTTTTNHQPKFQFHGVKPILGAAIPQIAKVTLRFTMGALVALYILNQKHVLPKPLSAWTSKTLFWPTLPITMSRRIGKWSTDIDDSIVLGGAPFGFLGVPERLYDDYGVRGVINMCQEYCGPQKAYEKLGIEELCLPTTDHFEPSFEDMKKAVEFIEDYKTSGKGKVYIHCRAGHGRSAAIAYVWLLQQQGSDIDEVGMERLNEYLFEKRNVRKTLWKQPNVNKFRSWIHLNRQNSDADDDS